MMSYPLDVSPPRRRIEPYPSIYFDACANGGVLGMIRRSPRSDAFMTADLLLHDLALLQRIPQVLTAPFAPEPVLVLC